MGDLDATIQFTRRLDGLTGGVGTVGYCLGGLLAFLTAVRTNAEAAVSYYGVGIDKHLGEAATFTTPLLKHIAEEDEFVPQEARARIVAALSAKPNVEIHTFPRLHARFRAKPGRPLCRRRRRTGKCADAFGLPSNAIAAPHPRFARRDRA